MCLYFHSINNKVIGLQGAIQRTKCLFLDELNIFLDSISCVDKISPFLDSQLKKKYRLLHLDLDEL